jgi:hypothetical protein
MKDKRQKDIITIEFTEDNLSRFLKEYYSTHRKTKNPIVESCLPRSMNKIITITNRIVQNNHKKHRALYVEYVLKELGLEKLGICECDLKIHYIFPTLVRHDLDNMIAGMKEVLDPFSDLGVILDDNYKIIKSITATASHEKGISKMIMTFENCKYDVQATLEAMEKEKIKREKREQTISEKKAKKKTVKKK